MNICIFGVGYVGLVSGAVFSDFGISVTLVDIDKKKIDLLKTGKSPIFEPGINEYIIRNLSKKRLMFETTSKKAIDKADIVFISVGTPNDENDNIDLSAVYEVAKQIGNEIESYKVIAIKSTVPVGTSEKVTKVINEQLDIRGVKGKVIFDVVSNPEFLREGKGIYDFTHPDKIVLGSKSDNAINIMKKLYAPLYLLEKPFVVCSNESAEIIKYANNAFLATKIAFINEIANVCEKTGANVNDVAKAIGMDGRISNKFLHPGPGFGGSCFPKDLVALRNLADDYDVDMKLVESVISSNKIQKSMVVKKLKNYLKNLDGEDVAILGITFKSDTDDVRASAALTVVRELIEENANVHVYDPRGMDNFKRYFEQINYHDSYIGAVKNAKAVIILTEWHEFRNMEIELISKYMDGNVFFDSRNMYDREYIEKFGLKYIGTGV